MTPSPLSQSTSAVHLHAQVSAPSSLGSRKLSKRRKASANPDVVDTNGDAGGDGDTQIENEPPSELPKEKEKESPGRLQSFIRRTSQSLERREPTSRPVSSRRDSKRSSMLGKIAKKFSISRRPTQEFEPSGSSRSSTNLGSDWLHVRSSDARGRNSVASAATPRQTSPVKPLAEANEDVEPVIQAASALLAAQTVSSPEEVDTTKEADDSISLEDPFVIGKLTVANPDDRNSSMDELSPTVPTAPAEAPRPITQGPVGRYT